MAGIRVKIRTMKNQKTDIRALMLPLLILILLAAQQAEGEDEMDEKLSELTEQARTDLAAKLEIAVDDVEVVSARWVTWRDASCGCPKEGGMYAEVLTKGALIVLLGADDEEYRYHQCRTNPPFHCEDPSPGDPLPDDSVEDM